MHYGRLFSKLQNNDNRIGVFSNQTSNVLRVGLSSSGNQQTKNFSDLTPFDQTWHHIAVVLDPIDPERPLISDVLLYVDGERRTIYKMEEADINTGDNENVRIGASYGPGTNTFGGLIDEAAIFNRVVGLTAIQRAFLQ